MKADACKRGEKRSPGASLTAKMAFPGRRWEEAAPEAEGVDSTGLEEALRYLARRTGRDGITEVAVVRNGRLIWRGERATVRHNVWSCTKSFTSTVLGLLVDAGRCSLDTPAKEHLPVLAPMYPDVILRHFATMSSGYDGGGDQSRNPFIPTPPLFLPGTRFQYWDSAMNQFLNVLTCIAGEPAKELFGRSIAERIGMNRDDWDWKVYCTIGGLLVNGGAGNQGKGVHISALEMARFAHLFLNRGNWGGEQLISARWVDLATATQVPASLPHHGRRGKDGPGGYGFNWWTNGRRSDGTRRWPGAPAGTFAACGFNNNRCFVIPEWRMVFVRLGQDGNINDKIYSTFFKAFGKILR